MRKKIWTKAFLFILSPLAIGYLSSFLSFNSSASTYEVLKLPSFSPPSWVFAPVWTGLYLLMGLAAFLIWKKRKEKDINLALAVYFSQLILNFFWTLFYFGQGARLLAFLDIMLLLLLIAANIILFARIRKLSAYLLAPYFLWVAFASVLNYSTWILNR